MNERWCSTRAERREPTGVRGLGFAWGRCVPVACHSSPACRPDTEGGAHSSTWAIICHREGGGGGVGAAASSRLQILASQSKMAARAPIRAPACHSREVRPFAFRAKSAAPEKRDAGRIAFHT